MVRFLVDNSLSPFVSESLNKLSYDSVHVRDINLQDATDETIFEFAKEKERTIISADTDFSYILSKRKSNNPSLILFRKGAERIPSQQVELLQLNLTKELINELNKGSVVIIEQERIRIKTLPIRDES